MTQLLPALASEVIDKYRTDFQDLNTWGDAIVAAAKDPYALAHFALDYRDFFNNRNWADHHLPAALRPRIAIHSGALYFSEDPIRKTKGIIGTQVNLAARIEPIAVPGQVWVTQQFRNLLDQQTDATVAFDHLGTHQLAKNFGEADLYHLRRTGEESAKKMPPGQKRTIHRSLVLMRCVHFAQDRLIAGVEMLAERFKGKEHHIEVEAIGALCGQYDVFALVCGPSFEVLCEFSELLKTTVAEWLRQVETRHLVPDTLYRHQESAGVRPTQIVFFSCRPDQSEKALNRLRDMATSNYISPFIITLAGRTFGASDLFCFVHTPTRKDYADFVRDKLARCFQVPLQYFDFTTLSVLSPKAVRGDNKF